MQDAYDETGKFLSTPSARRATVIRAPLPPKLVISIHALREEGDAGTEGLTVAKAISIHALREEGDSRSSPCRAI